MFRRRPFLFIALFASLAMGPVTSWAQVTTLPTAPQALGAGSATHKDAETRRPAAKAPEAASDLPLLALLGLGLLLTGAGMVSSIRPSRNRA